MKKPRADIGAASSEVGFLAAAVFFVAAFEAALAFLLGAAFLEDGFVAEALAVFLEADTFEATVFFLVPPAAFLTRTDFFATVFFTFGFPAWPLPSAIV